MPITWQSLLFITQFNLTLILSQFNYEEAEAQKALRLSVVESESQIRSVDPRAHVLHKPETQLTRIGFAFGRCGGSIMVRIGYGV